MSSIYGSEPNSRSISQDLSEWDKSSDGIEYEYASRGITDAIVVGDSELNTLDVSTNELKSNQGGSGFGIDDMFLRYQDPNESLDRSYSGRAKERFPSSYVAPTKTNCMDDSESTLNTEIGIAVDDETISITEGQNLKANQTPSGWISGQLDRISLQSKRVPNHTTTVYNLLVVGQEGTGKSIFKSMLSHGDQTEFEDPQIEKIREELLKVNTSYQLHFNDRCQLPLLQGGTEVYVKGGQVVKVNVSESCQLGGNIDGRASWHSLEDHLIDLLRCYMAREAQPDRKLLTDCRIHACIYFFSPSTLEVGKSHLSALVNLQEYTNVLPVIGKSDTVIIEELALRKAIIGAQLRHHKVDCFQPDEGPVEFPLFIASSNKEYLDDESNPFKARKVGGLLVDIFNPVVSDNEVLRNILYTNHMLRLIEFTDARYSLFREQEICNLQDWSQKISTCASRNQQQYRYSRQGRSVSQARPDLFHRCMSGLAVNSLICHAMKCDWMDLARPDSRSMAAALSARYEAECEDLEKECEALLTFQRKEYELAYEATVAEIVKLRLTDGTLNLSQTG